MSEDLPTDYQAQLLRCEIVLKLLNTLKALVLLRVGQGRPSYSIVYYVQSEYSWRMMGKQDKPVLILISMVVS